MRFPRMPIRHWMVFVAMAAIDLTCIVQDASHPLATLAFFGTLAVLVLSPVMLLLAMLAAED
jgi:hypothetical protein